MSVRVGDQDSAESAAFTSFVRKCFGLGTLVPPSDMVNLAAARCARPAGAAKQRNRSNGVWTAPGAACINRQKRLEQGAEAIHAGAPAVGGVE